MYGKSISKKMYDLLQDHLIEMEKAKKRLVRETYYDNVEESIGIGAFFKEYDRVIRNYLDGAEIGKSAEEGLPFAIIGSVVEVQDTEDMETYRYKLVLPYEKNPDTRIDYASCISPLGKALLLRSEGQKVNVEIPTGNLYYLIKGISLAEQCPDRDCSGQKQMA